MAPAVFAFKYSKIMAQAGQDGLSLLAKFFPALL
jgi:hypothetical protein